jgi:cathepsin A (carboxypeptidase C)
MRASLLLASLPAALAAAAQILLPDSPSALPVANPYDAPYGYSTDQVESPDGPISLASLGSEFTVLTSPLYPDHRVRIKSTDGWCDPDARSYTG